MDDIRKVNLNRPMQSNMNEQVYAPAPRRGFGGFLSFLILAIVLVVAGYALVKFDVISLGGSGNYKAVFLVNGQVYFGKLSGQNSQFPTLTDVYYLQVNQSLQPAEEGATGETVNDISLVKLGGELHGPTDRMDINRDQILLIEELKTDSNVVRAIEEHKKNPAGTQPAAAN